MNRIHHTPRRITVAVLSIALVAALAGCQGAPPADREVRPDIRTELVEWARLAQNAHNMQTWRVVADPRDVTRLTLYLEPSRMLPETDPPARQVTISAGTFLAVLEARAAQLGYEARIDLLPAGDYTVEQIASRPVAEVTLVPASGVRSEFAVAADPDAITRPTVKYRYRPAALDAGTIDRIESYGTDAIRISVVTEPAEVAWINELSVEAFTLEMENEPTMLESYDNTRMTGRQRRAQPWGLSYTQNFPVRTLVALDAISSIAPQKPEAYARTGIRIYEKAMEEINAYVVIVTDSNDRRTQVEAGMRLQALWMELHAVDHVGLPNSQALQEYPEMAELYDRVHQRYAPEGGTVQMILAVAQPKGGVHRFSPRIAAEDLIVTGD